MRFMTQDWRAAALALLTIAHGDLDDNGKKAAVAAVFDELQNLDFVEVVDASAVMILTLQQIASELINMIDAAQPGAGNKILQNLGRLYADGDDTA